jgi:tetratricopeptide (TPR) repeat protein
MTIATETSGNIAVEDLRLGLIALRREEWTIACTRLEAAVAAAPEWAAAHAYLSGAYMAVGRADEAMDSVDRALALEPDGFAPRMKAGELTLRLGDLVTAQSHFLAAVRAAVPASADEFAAHAALVITRRGIRKGISHASSLPRLPRWRRPVAAVTGRLRRADPRGVAG